jgi:hypothetical protein
MTTAAAPVDPLTVPCPYCGVPSGERCVVQGGRYGVDYPMPPYARRPHTARTRLALERGSERFSQLRGGACNPVCKSGGHVHE